MEVVPYIDIVDPARIRALLSDPRNFVWRAVDSETLDTWTPDLGLTGYPNPSIYRPSGVAQSGMASTLRHRFWGTVEHQTDHTGRRYVGILMYADAGEDCPLEIRLAANEVGRIEPARHDNRLHLIVVDRPVDFIGEMEVFRLTAPGRGTYRIEQFVLLNERPESDCFIPTIERLSATTSLQPDGLVQADLHFITSEIAAVRVEITGDDRLPRVVDEPAPATLHHIRIRDLAAGMHYRATLTATEMSGQTNSQTVEIATGSRPASAEQEVIVPVELIHLADSNVSGLPLTFGVPLPQGMIAEAASCQLLVGGTAYDSQVRIHARWPDHSARWALVDAVVPPDLAAAGGGEAQVRFGSPESSPAGELVIEADETSCRIVSSRLRVSAQVGGSLSIALRHDPQTSHPLAFSALLGSGQPLTSGPIQELTVEESGSQRAVLRFSVLHEDAQGVAHLKSTVRLHVYAGQSFVRLVHRLAIITPAAAVDDETALVRLRFFALTLPWAGARSVRALGQTWPVTGGWALRHEHDLAYTLQSDGGWQTCDGHAPGHIRVEAESGTLGLGVKNFWQTYPKGLSVTPDAVRIDLFPERAAESLPGDEDAWHRLYFWLKDGQYLLKTGMNLTSEILLDFGGENDAVFDWLEQPPVARPTIDYLNACRALNPIAPKADSTLPDYEALADQALESFHDDREHYRAYGQVNFGDWYGESGWSWGNNEYDPAYCAYVEFLRGGDPRWAAWGAESVRHLVDVDTLNCAADTGDLGGQAMHMPGHLGGYLPPLFRSKMAGTKSIPSHTWVEGPLLHYLLTGDENARETIEKTRGWLLQKRWFDYYDFSNCRESGWHIIHLCMLATAMNDPDSLNAAAIIVRRVLERQAPGGGWERMLTESHCGCGYPRCRGEAGFMVGVLLSGLKRYHQLTGDEQVAQAIVGGARWLIEHTYDEKSGYFRYTSCPNRTLGGGFQQTLWVLEGLADAYEISGDPEIGSYVRDGLKAVGVFPDWVGHLGLGKAMAQQMRYVPTLLAALLRRPV